MKSQSIYVDTAQLHSQEKTYWISTLKKDAWQ